MVVTVSARNIGVVVVASNCWDTISLAVVVGVVVVFLFDVVALLSVSLFVEVSCLFVCCFVLVPCVRSFVVCLDERVTCIEVCWLFRLN